MWSWLCVLAGLVLCVLGGLSLSHVLLTKMERLDGHIQAIVLQPCTPSNETLRDYHAFTDVCIQKSLRVCPWWVPHTYVRETVEDFALHYLGRTPL